MTGGGGGGTGMGADTGTAATTGPLESCACPYVAGGPGIKPDAAAFNAALSADVAPAASVRAPLPVSSSLPASSLPRFFAPPSAPSLVSTRTVSFTSSSPPALTIPFIIASSSASLFAAKARACAAMSA
eukprot:CAMPEP_0181358640 /NCGR_PEP_ID=MMETSP1106-20121128/5629_1 /TAXON_ID=81844 /ORGANISM="Mantoniella antarctica, Strain SL-175" /LENGTH=128 /DNA_ID=CAMNT_0023471637 /DNA_START=834 /DNA_END=1220 /DNA_ORIENTATION=-